MFPGSLTGAKFIEWSSHDQSANYRYYFGAGGRFQHLNGRKATRAHWTHVRIPFQKPVDARKTKGHTHPQPHTTRNIYRQPATHTSDDSYHMALIRES